MAASLSTRLRVNNLSIADTILQSTTPMEAKLSGAFKTLSVEYDRPDAPSLRHYADNYYLRAKPQIRNPRIFPRFRQRWRDYRSTVMAFVKADGDPRTPDQSRGASSIQVTFRDWITPWIILEYFPEKETRVQDFRDRIIPKVTPNFNTSLMNVKAEINEFVRNRGLIGRQKQYQIMHEALDGLTVSTPSGIFPYDDKVCARCHQFTGNT